MKNIRLVITGIIILFFVLLMFERGKSGGEQTSRLTTGIPVLSDDAPPENSKPVSVQVSAYGEKLAERNTAATDSKKTGVNCSGVMSEADEEERDNDIMAKIDSALMNPQSHDIELMSAIMGIKTRAQEKSKGSNPTTDSDDQVEELLTLANRNPSDELLNFHYLNACINASNSEKCSDQYLKQAINKSENNGAAWALLTGAYLKKGKVDEALESLIRAGNSANYDSYRSHRIGLFTRAITSLGVDRVSALISSIGYDAAVSFGSFSEISKFCKQTDQEISAEIVQACLQYGERLERKGNTLLETAFGLSLQDRIYQSTDQLVSRERVVKRRANFNREMNALRSTSFYLPEDESFVDYWLLTMQNHNELEASKLVNEEMERLRKMEKIEPCAVKSK